MSKDSEQIDDKFSKMTYDDLLEIVHKRAIENSQKRHANDFVTIALCRIVYSHDKILDEIIRSDKVVEGVLKDIQNAADRIAGALENKQ